ncbi:MAG: multicopper oxidase domain-containing protein [Methylocapsa sp.]|nr:multicopper oxidase domain-containing protein [Methylocapsa sp.]
MIRLLDRRDLLRSGAIAGSGLLLDGRPVRTAAVAASTTGPSAEAPPESPADVTLRIGPVLVDVDEDHTISTIGYNGAAPGPLIRFKEGKTVTVELINETDTPEFVHWHGQLIPPAMDGAPEENSLVVPAHGELRYRLTPAPAGLRFVHSHVLAGPDLHRGSYTGQHAPVYIEPARDPGRYDREVFMTTHEWEPFFTSEEMEDAEEREEQKEEEDKEEAESRQNGWEVGYRLFSINGRALGHGEPVRVREGERVLFQILNASATENIKLALPGHRFLVVALDGNPVPAPKLVNVLQLGTAERIGAIVEMDHPGVWVFGTPKDDDRKNGMGIVVEYAGSRGAPQWVAPPKSKWDYTIFGGSRPAREPGRVIPMVFRKINGGRGGFNRWTINGNAYEDQGEPAKLQRGERYRLTFDNRTDDAHPLHLHRNIFELTSVGGKPTAGIMKDVVLIKGFGRLEVDFTADQPGRALFHCHQQLHMDYGFMQLFDVV